MTHPTPADEVTTDYQWCTRWTWPDGTVDEMDTAAWHGEQAEAIARKRAAWATRHGAEGTVLRREIRTGPWLPVSDEVTP